MGGAKRRTEGRKGNNRAFGQIAGMGREPHDIVGTEAIAQLIGELIDCRLDVSLAKDRGRHGNLGRRRHRCRHRCCGLSELADRSLDIGLA